MVSLHIHSHIDTVKIRLLRIHIHGYTAINFNQINNALIIDLYSLVMREKCDINTS